jgi:hypothetical protein
MEHQINLKHTIRSIKNPSCLRTWTLMKDGPGLENWCFFLTAEITVITEKMFYLLNYKSTLSLYQVGVD